MTSPKQRMLNAYRGVYSDCYPVSPEFWYYYPAKVLGVDMVEFEREIPHWEAMLKTFTKYNADGWCAVGAVAENPHVEITRDFRKVPGNADRYRETQVVRFDGARAQRSIIYQKHDPSWVETYPVKTEAEVDSYIRAALSHDVSYDFTEAIRAHREAGEGILVEYSLGIPFFDFFCDMMGFENAILYFMSDNDEKLEAYLARYTEHQIKHLREASEKTDFESVFIGCNASCNSLFGPTLWRKWDKPYLLAVTQEAHRLGMMVHNHNHGKIMATVPDLAAIGFDCVCPFEREPGDVIGFDGLVQVRRLLGGRVTFNGNVNTVATLIQGGPDDVRREVREIKEAFTGTPRLIIGTGDQVGSETPEENIIAMIEEGRK